MRSVYHFYLNCTCQRFLDAFAKSLPRAVDRIRQAGVLHGFLLHDNVMFSFAQELMSW